MKQDSRVLSHSHSKYSLTFKINTLLHKLNSSLSWELEGISEAHVCKKFKTTLKTKLHWIFMHNYLLLSKISWIFHFFAALQLLTRRSTLTSSCHYYTTYIIKWRCMYVYECICFMSGFLNTQNRLCQTMWVISSSFLTNSTLSAWHDPTKSLGQVSLNHLLNDINQAIASQMQLSIAWFDIKSLWCCP